MASARRTARGTGKVGGPWAPGVPGLWRALLPSPPCGHSLSPSVSQWTGHGVRGPHQGPSCHPTTLAPSRASRGNAMWRFESQRLMWMSGSAARPAGAGLPVALCWEGHPKGRKLGWDSHQLLPWYGLDSGLQGLRVLLTGLMRLDRRGQTLALKAGVRHLSLSVVSGPWGATYLSGFTGQPGRGPSASRGGYPWPEQSAGPTPWSWLEV